MRIKQHKLFLLVVAIIISSLVSTLTAVASKHIAVAYDRSKSMRDRWESNITERTNQYLLHILFEGIPQIDRMDSVYPDSPPFPDGPLLRKEDLITFFLFDAPPFDRAISKWYDGTQQSMNSIYNWILPQLPKSKNKFTGDWTYLDLLYAHVGEIFEKQSKDQNIRILVSDKGQSKPPRYYMKKEYHQRISTYKRFYEEDLWWSINVGGIVEIEIVQIKPKTAVIPRRSEGRATRVPNLAIVRYKTSTRTLSEIPFEYAAGTLASPYLYVVSLGGPEFIESVEYTVQSGRGRHILYRNTISVSKSTPAQFTIDIPRKKIKSHNNILSFEVIGRSGSVKFPNLVMKPPPKEINLNWLWWFLGILIACVLIIAIYKWLPWKQIVPRVRKLFGGVRSVRGVGDSASSNPIHCTITKEIDGEEIETKDVPLTNGETFSLGDLGFPNYILKNQNGELWLSNGGQDEKCGRSRMFQDASGEYVTLKFDF